MKVHCQPIRDNIPPFKAYKGIDGKFIKTSTLRELGMKYAIRDVYEGSQATFSKITIYDSSNNKKLVERVRHIFKKDKSNPSFTSTSNIKTLWKKGLLPSVTKGLYGDTLTLSNLSQEHLLARSLGGKTYQRNLALASKQANNRRGNRPLHLFLTEKMLDDYCEQWEGVKVGRFDGDKYIRTIKKTVKKIFRMEQENVIENCK